MKRAVVVIAFAIAVVVAVTLWPLLATTAAFACFGAAHVVVELRYVADRFGTRLPRRTWSRLGVVLLMVVAVRSISALCASSSLSLSSSVSSSFAALELLLAGAVLALGVRWTTARGIGVLGAGLVAAIVVGAAVSPLHTLLLLSVLHNLTPIGFVVERAPAGHRARTLLWSSGVMCGVPLFVASGLPLRLCAEHVDVLSAWPSSPALYESYATWLPPTMFDAPDALALFSAAVSAQLLHYGAVLWWLPRAARSAGETAPVTTTVLVAMVATSGVLALAFAIDFRAARLAYGLLAAVHAWIELPVLFGALSSTSSSTSLSSTCDEAG